MTPKEALMTLKNYIDNAPMPAGNNPKQIAQILQALNDAFVVLNDLANPKTLPE